MNGLTETEDPKKSVSKNKYKENNSQKHDKKVKVKVGRSLLSDSL